MQAKTAHNYHFLQSLQPEMKSRGVDDLLLVDNQGYITEATVANIFVIKGDLITTPPDSGSILVGITRQSIATVLQSPLMFSKYKKNPVVREKNITKADLYTADEVFMCGTYAEVIPILEVDGRVIGDGEPGFYTKVVRSEYALMTRGAE